jgi:hypothetical protein
MVHPIACKITILKRCSYKKNLFPVHLKEVFIYAVTALALF